MLNLKNSTKLVALLIGTIVIVSMWATSVNAQTELTENSKLALNGIGPIRVGMTVDEASLAAGIQLIKQHTVELNEYQCSYLKPKGEPEGISFMVTKGRIARVNINNKRITTIRGAKIGDTIDRIISLYPGQIQIIKAPLTSRPEGNSKHLTFVPKDAADKNYRIIFETTFDRVREFRSGKLPEVEFLEGCL